jgi:hypothetical protein
MARGEHVRALYRLQTFLVGKDWYADLPTVTAAINGLTDRLEGDAARCAYCGKPFLPKRADARTCSPACRMALHRKRRETAKRNAAPKRETANR